MLNHRVDPFDVARDEVEAAVRKVQFMHKEWKKLLERENTAESKQFKDLHAEINGELQLLNYDLQEVERSIQTVEQNRQKFHLDDSQLAARRAFVAKSRAAHKEVQGDLNGQQAKSKMENDQRQALLSHKSKEQEQQQRRNAREAEVLFEQEQMLQRQLKNQQEDELVELSKATQRVGQVAKTINGELQLQQQLLEELNEDIDEQTHRMNAVMKGVGTLLKTGNRYQIYSLLGLIGIFLLLVFLIFGS